MAESRKLVELVDVSKTYQTLKEETLALSGVSLRVHDGEFLSIVGPSGCGKSTILSLISGLLQPSAGQVRFSSEALKSGHAVAYMLQRDYLFEWRTIEQNVLLGLEVQNKLTKQSREYAVGLLQKYGLGKFLHHRPDQLSGGMRQKAALIRTLAVKPQILLLDEPFSALDYQTRLTLAQEVSEIIRKEKKTAVLVTHDISEAISLSSRVVVMSKRPSRVKKILPIDLPHNLSALEKQKHPKFNDYFDIIWNEMIDDAN